MRLLLDIDTNTPLTSREVFEAIEKSFPDRMIELHLIDESNDGQFYEDERIIEKFKELHESLEVDEDGYLIDEDDNDE